MASLHHNISRHINIGLAYKMDIIDKRPTHHPRQIRKFLSGLWELQVNDRPLPAYMVLAAKYLLRTTRLCNYVTIVAESSDSFTPLDTYLDSCPVFIVSQLESQGLTKSPSVHTPSIPVPALILPCLPRGDDPVDNLYPTLFSWYCSSSHRTNHVFAVTTVNMSVHTKYSIEQLKELHKGSGSSATLNFSGNPEVGKHTLHSSDTANSKLTPSTRQSYSRLFKRVI